MHRISAVDQCGERGEARAVSPPYQRSSSLRLLGGNRETCPALPAVLPSQGLLSTLVSLPTVMASLTLVLLCALLSPEVDSLSITGATTTSRTPRRFLSSSLVTSVRQ